MSLAHAERSLEATPKSSHNMRDVMALRDQRQAELLEHPFFDWLRSPGVPLDKKFDILPALILFVMNFRDLNLWVIRFPEDGADELKDTINSSTVEDETHSRLFLEDWRKMFMDDRLDWAPSDLLWWMFLSEEMESFREYGAEFIRLCIDDGGDPLVRFAHSEAAEACGHVFFSVASPLADELGRQRGVQYRYLGTFHLDLETGHVLDSEPVFHDQPMTLEQYQLSIVLLERMFNVFGGIFDRFLDYARDYVDRGRWPKSRISVIFTAPESDVSSAAIAPSAGSKVTHTSQIGLEQHLARRKSEASAHPFFAWLADERIPAIKRLQRFIPLWAFDALGYRDLNAYFMRYDDPKDDLERSVNAVSSTLATHSQLFLQDWKALGLDEVLRWPASDAMGFFFLDHVTDVHRHTLLRFGMEAFRHPHAFDRLWFIEALEATGHDFFRRTKAVALQAEAQEGIRLDYFGDRHAKVNPATPEPVIDFKALAIEEPARLANVHRLIDLVFDALDTNLTLSLTAAKSNKFSVR